MGRNRRKPVKTFENDLERDGNNAEKIIKKDQKHKTSLVQNTEETDTENVFEVTQTQRKAKKNKTTDINEDNDTIAIDTVKTKTKKRKKLKANDTSESDKETRVKSERNKHYGEDQNDDIKTDNMTQKRDIENNDNTAVPKLTKSVSKIKTKTSGKTNKIVFDDEGQPQEVHNTTETLNNPSEKKSRKFLNDDEAEVKDEDIDKFCDELDEKDNVQFENWVKLIEEKLHSKKVK